MSTSSSLPHEAEAPLHGGQDVLGRRWALNSNTVDRERIALKMVEIGVFRGRGDQGDLTVLDELQQGLLLLFVEVLNLIQV